jgi:hypothetical protein
MRTFALLAVLAGCSGDKTTPTTDTDGDADTDADSDADVDADTDADADPASLAGHVDYERQVDGVTTCTMSIDVTGTPYAGDCDGCAWAFEITTAATPTGDCADADNVMTLAETAYTVNLKLGLVESYQVGQDTVANAVLLGNDLYYGGSTFPGPNWSLLGYEGLPTADVSWDGAALGIASARTFTESDFTHWLQMCGGTYLGGAAPATIAGGSVAGELGCDGQAFDLWSFDADAGATVRLWVDNVDGPDLLTPFLTVTDDASCQIGHSTPSFACAFGGEDCGSIEFVAPTTGTYRVAAETADPYGLCSGGTGGYVLTGNADGVDLGFGSVAEDQPFFENQRTIDDSATFTGTVVP